MPPQPPLSQSGHAQYNNMPFPPLDPQGSISIPGSVGMLPIERPADIETGHFSKMASLVYHYGFADPGKNLKLYNTVVTALANMFRERCKRNPKCECVVVRWLLPEASSQHSRTTGLSIFGCYIE